MVNLASNPNLWPTLVGLVALALAPLAFLLWFIYTRDKLNPEPRGLILRVFGLGVLAFIPVFLVRQFLPLPYGLMGLVVVPILSELTKFGVVKAAVYNHAEFDEPLDGIIFAAVAGLGFASLGVLGGILYTYLNVLRLGPGPEASGAAWRAVINMFALQGLLTAPGQALWSSLWGYGLGLGKFSPVAQSQGLAAQGLLAAILAHAAFNGLTMEPSWWVNRLGLVLLIVLLWLVVRRCIRYTLALSPYPKV